MVDKHMRSTTKLVWLTSWYSVAAQFVAWHHRRCDLFRLADYPEYQRRLPLCPVLEERSNTDALVKTLAVGQIQKLSRFVGCLRYLHASDIADNFFYDDISQIRQAWMTRKMALNVFSHIFVSRTNIEVLCFTEVLLD
jgi:hypothetical protein